MNKFLSVIVLVALLYSPQVYANEVVEVVGKVVDAAVDAVVNVADALVAVAAIAIVGAVDAVGLVFNAAIDVAAAAFDFVGLDPIADFLDNTGHLIVNGIVDAIDYYVISASSAATNALDNFFGVDDNAFGYLLNLINCNLSDYDAFNNVPGCSNSDSFSPIDQGAITPPVSLGTFTTTIFANALSTCTGITLSGINAQGHNYAIVRDGDIVEQLLSSETSYTDKNLKPHTNYSYTIRIPYPAESGYQTTDSAPIAAYTRCLPACGFGVTSSSVAKYGATELRWKCDYNDPTVDTGTCKIIDSLGTLSKAIDAESGSMMIKVNENNQYMLQCANVDGAIAIPQSVSVFTPSVKEVRP